MAHSEGPHLPMMPLQLLYQLKLISIPILQHLVLADRPEVVRLLAGVVLLHVAGVVLLEGDLHDGVVVCEERLVAVAEVEAPDFDVFVGGAGYYEFGVGGDVHGEYWELPSKGID